MNTVTIPECPRCGELQHTMTYAELAEAQGCSACDRCGAILIPSASELNAAAVELATKSLVGERAAWGPSVWFAELNTRRDALLAEWLEATAQARVEFDTNPPKFIPVR